MKLLRILLIAFAACLCLTLPVRAFEADIYEQSGADALLDALPAETRRLLSNAGITPQGADPGALGVWFEEIAAQVRDDLTAPVRILTLLFGIVILSRIVQEFAPQEITGTVDLCSVLAAAILLVPQFTGMIGQTAVVTQTLSGFLLAAIPVYAGILVLSGSAAVGSSYGALTLAAANVLSALSGQIFLPVTRVILALSTVASVTSYDLQKVTDAIGKGVKTLLTFAVSIFTGVLSLQTLISAQADAVSGKAVKMIASGAVPIVGGAFGDALSVLGASMSTVKSGVGAFGVLAAAAVFLPLSFTIGVWILGCEAAGFAAKLFSVKGMVIFLDGCAAVLRMLLALLFSVGAAAMISAAVLLCVRGAYG